MELAPLPFRKRAEPVERGLRLERLDVMHVGLSLAVDSVCNTVIVSMFTQ